MGKIVARAEGPNVEIIMTDGEDAAICTMDPTEAAEFVILILDAMRDTHG